jgi:hypothetical protein
MPPVPRSPAARAHPGRRAGSAAEVLGGIRVPVHYRQADGDRLWIVDQGEVDGFARALEGAPRVDAALVRGTGHCMDSTAWAAPCSCSSRASRCSAPRRRDAMCRSAARAWPWQAAAWPAWA